MNDIVEAMARGIAKAMGHRWETLSNLRRADMHDVARAAIRACHDAGGLVLRGVPGGRAMSVVTEEALNTALIAYHRIRPHEGVVVAMRAALAVAERVVREDERALIVANLRAEADAIPCDEDAKVTHDNATLIEAGFSYDRAEELSRARGAA